MTAIEVLIRQAKTLEILQHERFGEVHGHVSSVWLLLKSWSVSQSLSRFKSSVVVMELKKKFSSPGELKFIPTSNENLENKNVTYYM